MVRKHADRYWIERAFQDAKTSLGMADYQARGWVAWQHHMSMVMLAMLFMIRERDDPGTRRSQGQDDRRDR